VAARRLLVVIDAFLSRATALVAPTSARARDDLSAVLGAVGGVLRIVCARGDVAPFLTLDLWPG